MSNSIRSHIAIRSLVTITICDCKLSSAYFCTTLHCILCIFKQLADALPPSRRRLYNPFQSRDVVNKSSTITTAGTTPVQVVKPSKQRASKGRPTYRRRSGATAGSTSSTKTSPKTGSKSRRNRHSEGAYGIAMGDTSGNNDNSVFGEYTNTSTAGDDKHATPLTVQGEVASSGDNVGTTTTAQITTTSVVPGDSEIEKGVNDVPSVPSNVMTSEGDVTVDAQKKNSPSPTISSNDSAGTDISDGLKEGRTDSRDNSVSQVLPQTSINMDITTSPEPISTLHDMYLPTPTVVLTTPLDVLLEAVEIRSTITTSRGTKRQRRSDSRLSMNSVLDDASPGDANDAYEYTDSNKEGEEVHAATSTTASAVATPTSSAPTTITYVEPVVEVFQAETFHSLEPDTFNYSVQQLQLYYSYTGIFNVCHCFLLLRLVNYISLCAN